MTSCHTDLTMRMKTTSHTWKSNQCILYCRNCTSRWVINEMSPAKTGNIGKDSKCCKDPKFEKAGPMWCNAMGDPGLADKMAAKSANEKDRKFLSVLASEYKSGIVGFYDIHRICKISHLEIPRKEDLRNALIKQGNQSVATHVSGTAIKTDASLHSIIRTIRSQQNLPLRCQLHFPQESQSHLCFHPLQK